MVILLLFYFSIEFDKDCDHFAIAGVTKKIKVGELVANLNPGVNTDTLISHNVEVIIVVYKFLSHKIMNVQKFRGA